MTNSKKNIIKYDELFLAHNLHSISFSLNRLIEWSLNNDRELKNEILDLNKSFDKLYEKFEEK